LELLRSCLDEEKAIAKDIVRREYTEDEPTLLMGRDRFGDVNDGFTTALADEHGEQSASAYASGGPLLDSSALESHRTLIDALISAAHTRPERGITYVSDGRAVFESYAALLHAARTMLVALRRRGLRQGEPIALQVGIPMESSPRARPRASGLDDSMSISRP